MDSPLVIGGSHENGIHHTCHSPAWRMCHNYMKRRFVILNEVKNLMASMSSMGEILRLHLRMTLRHSLLTGESGKALDARLSTRRFAEAKGLWVA